MKTVDKYNRQIVNKENYFENNSKSGSKNNSENNDSSDDIILTYNLNNEIINLMFYLFGFIVLLVMAAIGKEFFSSIGAAMGFGLIIMQANLVGRLLIKKYKGF